MSFVLPTPGDQDWPTQEDMDAADAEYRQSVLRHILDAGVAVAQTISHAAAAHTAAIINGDVGPGDPAVADLAVAYERTARAVRRTLALSERFAAGPRLARQKRTDARKHIIRAVEDAIERRSGAAGHGNDPNDELRAELHERLDDPALDHDIQTRPVADIIADICRDLGLAARAGNHPGHWKRRTPVDIQALCAKAAQPCTPPFCPVGSPGWQPNPAPSPLQRAPDG